MTTSETPPHHPRCHYCHGKGYIRCDCWPADCICGQDDRECWVCDGTGDQWPDDDEWDPRGIDEE